MIARFVCFALASAGLAGAATPEGYELSVTILTLPVSTASPSFGTQFFFTSGDQTLYRLVPAGTPVETPATACQFWSPSVGSETVMPPAGYAAIEPRAMNNAGTVVGKVIDPTDLVYREAAFTWSPGGAAAVPGVFDPISSSLSALAPSGYAGGLNSTGGVSPHRVTWDSTEPTGTPTSVSLPPGYTGGQVQGVSDSGAAALVVDDGADHFRAAVWDGASTRLLGSPLATDELLYPANLAMNARGDIAVLIFVEDGAYRLELYPAWTNYTSPYRFNFEGPITSVYNLHLSNNGIASFDAGSEFVHVVSMANGGSRTFAGYGSFLNASGELVFGQGGKLKYWNAAAWTGSPVTVPLDLPAGPSAPVVVGFNDDGHLLVRHANAAATQVSLSVLEPIGPDPVVTLKPTAKRFRFYQGDPVRRRIVDATVTQAQPDNGRVRFEFKGTMPDGLKLRHRTGIVAGHPAAVGRRVIRVYAAYHVDGVRQRTKALRVPIFIRPVK